MIHVGPFQLDSILEFCDSLLNYILSIQVAQLESLVGLFNSASIQAYSKLTEN